MKKLSEVSETLLHHYVLVKKWNSDLEFFKMETAFLHRMLDEYFIRLVSTNSVEEVKINGERLLRLEREESMINLQLAHQLKEIEWIAKNLILENKNRMAEAQKEITRKMVLLNLEFKALKKNIFNLVEKLRHKGNLAINV